MVRVSVSLTTTLTLTLTLLTREIETQAAKSKPTSHTPLFFQYSLLQSQRTNRMHNVLTIINRSLMLRNNATYILVRLDRQTTEIINSLPESISQNYTMICLLFVIQ